MSNIINDPLAREQVTNDVFRLATTLAGDTHISVDDLEAYSEFMLSGTKTEHYSDGRTKADVAVKLGVSATQLSKAVAGQDVLDIGCGKGVFASDLAKDKSVHVTALDSDPNVLNAVPSKPNITAIEGNGYDLIGSGLTPASFDAVFVTYATNFWARTPQQLTKSITEPLKVLRPGGSIYFTPIAQNLELRDAMLHGVFNEAIMDKKRAYQYNKICGLLAITAFGLVHELEDGGQITTAFRASHKNSGYQKKKLDDGRMISPNSYSVILTNS